MRLKEFRVREFRSVWDSGPITLEDQFTCLVGKNEAGKTTLLNALYRTNPIIAADALFDETYDYPKREVEDYRFAVESKKRSEAAVVECVYELSIEDKLAVSEIFGTKVLKSTYFKRITYYGKSNHRFTIEVDEAAARKHLGENSALSEELKKTLKMATDWPQFATKLGDAEQIEAVKELLILINKILEHGLAYYIYNSLIWPRAPKFLYFDEYYQMKGQANLNQLMKRQTEKTLEGSDYPLIGLINLARLKPQELVTSKNTIELKNKLEGAGNHLTRRIIKYWSQNKHIQMRFDVRDAKPEDPEGMRDGVNVWGEVYDTVHLAHTPLGSRSRGFVWFFSFLAWYEDVKRQQQNVVLLLDEPGLSLHGKAQADLLAYFDAELSDHQLIYSTHSPFMIDPRKLERVRIVQDLGIDTADTLPKEKDGTKVVTEIFDATSDSLFPLQGALGYEIHQSLFIGPNSLVVEGPSDMLYLNAISAELEREGRIGLSPKWVITPVGGSGKVPTFVALIAPQKGMNIATLLDIQASDKAQIEDLYKKKLLKKNQVVTYADFTEKKEADVEDLFDRDFYIGLVNDEFKKQLTKPIKATALNELDPRVIRSLESYLATTPLKSGTFNHYRPARYFSENITRLWPTIADHTRDRFERIFKQLNALID